MSVVCPSGTLGVYDPVRQRRYMNTFGIEHRSVKIGIVAARQARRQAARSRTQVEYSDLTIVGHDVQAAAVYAVCRRHKRVPPHGLRVATDADT